MGWITSQNDTAPKPRIPYRVGHDGLDYQSERHCSKTLVRRVGDGLPLDYQSERHCSKTLLGLLSFLLGWITSQNDTAPKRYGLGKTIECVGLPVRTTLLQNQSLRTVPNRSVGLPVRTTLLQNPANLFGLNSMVGLPVRTTLLQNPTRCTCGAPRVGLPVRTTLLQNSAVRRGHVPLVGLPVRTTLLQNAICF